MIIREVFVKLLLDSFGKLSIRHGLYDIIVCYVLLANVIWIVVLERDRLKALVDSMFFLIRKKPLWGTVFPTGLKRYKEPLVEPKEIG
ncbi:hypothetical protein Tco_0514212 [Tanacetum coccineum]